jgi:hypothetical protein
MVRELKESFLPWLTGQTLPLRPTLADYDAVARCWIEQIVLGRRHRTSKRLVDEPGPRSGRSCARFRRAS